MKRVITAETVAAAHKAGSRSIAAPRAEAIVTPGAWSKGRELGVSFDRSGPGDHATAPVRPSRAVDEGGAERSVDPSGLLVVRGKTVRLGQFSGAGPGRDIGLLDLVTAKDGSPMTAGIMSWSREDSFPWTLDYDEIDLVLEGVLEIHIDGRTVQGRPGDVLYIPKGSSIVFGTPSRTKVFYVTYPADWGAAASAAARPRK